MEGYELSATGNLTPDWTIIAGYTQQHATVTEGQNVAQDGSFRHGLHPETCLYAVDAVSGHQRSVRRRRCALCRKPAPGQRWCSRYPGSHRGGYWVADAKLGYRVNSNLDLQLNMYNLFDTDYVASINKSGYRYPGEPDLYADGERPFLSLRVGPLRPTRKNTAMMYHIPDVLSTDGGGIYPAAGAGRVDGRVTVGSRGGRQTEPADRYPNAAGARLQAAVLDMLRGHPQFFPPRCRGRFPRRCLTAMGRETYGFTSMAPFARTGGLDARDICQRRCSFAIRRAMRVANW